MKTVPLIDSVEKQIATGCAILIGADNIVTDDMELVHRAESYNVITKLDGDYILFHEPKFKACN